VQDKEKENYNRRNVNSMSNERRRKTKMASCHA
jgi:hypothetical protein